ncbi:alpha-hydroxy acid oxidase [Roseomonas elaeocarpi]|uniref:Alpha-hydroxy acid oxidase n=1 Tax=Roseomonas elaeocarpi TaxID=907779 RepID=A0ABV6JWM1_9PROT
MASVPSPPDARPVVRPAPALRRILNLHDFEPAARGVLPRPLFGYVAGAAEDNATLADNRAAFAEYGFSPRILTDVSRRLQAVELLGTRWNAPFGIAPMGLAAMMSYRGDLVLARAAAGAGIPMVLSGTSLIPMEEVARAAPDSWFQAYLPGEPDRIAALVSRAERAGFTTLVLTVDTAVLPSRENNVRNGFSTPLRPSLRLAWDGMIRPRWLAGMLARTLLRHGMPHFENSYAERGAPIIARNAQRDLGKRDHLNWTHLEQIRRQWRGKLLVKGIIRGEDAARAREIGADAVIVSTHGGRQLDGTVASLRALPEVVAAAGGMPVLLDSGVRRGTDVLKAIALGARFVFVGRPFLFAAAVAGEEGVRHAISLLSGEVDRDMAMLGINSLEELDSSWLRRIGGVVHGG